MKSGDFLDTVKLGFSVLGRYFICLIMCFFITFSIIAVFTMATVEIIGYDAFVVDANDEIVAEYTHLFSDGEDTKKTQYEAEGYKVSTLDKATEFGGSASLAAYIISQIIGLVFFVFVVPRNIYFEGAADANKVARGRAEKDALKPLKIAIPTAVFSFLSFIYLIIGKAFGIKGAFTIYNFANYHLYPYQKLIFGDAISAEAIGWGSVALAFLPTLLVILVCTVTYILGYKGINVYEKAVYQKR